MDTSPTMKKQYYVLKIYIDTNIHTYSETTKKYREKIADIQKQIELYETGERIYMDAGFDLFTPTYTTIAAGSYSIPINQGIKCAMTFNDEPTAFYLYPRSSTGLKTPLRLSNSVGIIDSGYRGHIIAVFDNRGTLPNEWLLPCGEERQSLKETISSTSNNDGSSYNITMGDRLVQICGPNISYPIYPMLVNSVEDLGLTVRGTGGFGSTGR